MLRAPHSTPEKRRITRSALRIEAGWGCDLRDRTCARLGDRRELASAEPVRPRSAQRGGAAGGGEGEGVLEGSAGAEREGERRGEAVAAAVGVGDRAGQRLGGPAPGRAGGGDQPLAAAGAFGGDHDG